VKGRAQLRRKGAGIAVPRQLSTTLNALSGALRAAVTADNFVLTDNYLRQLDPELPTIEQDFRGIADLGDNVDAALPDLLRVLDNSSSSSRSLVDQQTQLAAFLRTTSGFNASAESITRENSQRFIDPARTACPACWPTRATPRSSPACSRHWASRRSPASTLSAATSLGCTSSSRSTSRSCRSSRSTSPTTATATRRSSAAVASTPATATPSRPPAPEAAGASAPRRCVTRCSAWPLPPMTARPSGR